MAGCIIPSQICATEKHSAALLNTLIPHIIPFQKEADLAPLIEWAENARFVLLGEATHGTREFYSIRAAITKKLIQERGFTVLALEASYPRTARLDAYINGGPLSLDQALMGFQVYPAWMWRNREFITLLCWLRHHNASLTDRTKRVHIFGLDLYGMYDAITSLKEHLYVLDRQMSQRIAKRLACFDGFGSSAITYGDMVRDNPARSCQKTVQGLTKEVTRFVVPLVQNNPHTVFFARNALQNARIIETGEEYFRLARQGDANGSWNLRDRFMADAMEAASLFFDQDDTGAKVVLWAHNSHVGDMSATSMGGDGQVSIGQLAWKRFQEHSFLVGFLTAEGTVAASSSWGGDAQEMALAVPMETSLEQLLSHIDIPNFYFQTMASKKLTQKLLTPRLQRFIGVEYYPDDEQRYHYSDTVLPGQFDAVFFIRKTHAVTPLVTLQEIH